jgi:hypothetical protein
VGVGQLPRERSHRRDTLVALGTLVQVPREARTIVATDGKLHDLFSR